MPGLRWWIAGLLMLATVVNYIDRQCLGVASTEIKADLGMTNETYSYVVSAFLITYGLMQPFMGRVMDWLGTRTGFMLAVAWWSIANMLHGLAGSWLSLAFFRILLGMGEAGNFPGSVKTIGEWFPPRQRTIGTGIFNSGASIGMVISAPLIALILMTLNWRMAFVITGGMGVVWIALWAIFYRPFDKHPWLTARERNLVLEGQKELAVADPPPGRGTWLFILSQRNFWGIALTRFLAEPAWQFMMFFLPLFLREKLGLTLGEFAFYGILPYIAADLGCLFGGFLPPLFVKAGLSVMSARKASAAVAAVMMMGVGLTVFASTATEVVIFVSIGLFAHQTLASTLLTLPADLFPKRMAGTAYGLAGTVGYVGGTAFILIAGYVTEHIGYNPMWAGLAFLDMVGVTLLWAIIRAPKAGTGTLAPPPLEPSVAA
jgi:ACS family hexuronate transporter-like MFS transporter